MRAALRLCNESLAFHRGFFAPPSIAIGLLNKAAYEIALDLYDDARATAQEGLEAAYAAAGLDYHAALSAKHLAAIASASARATTLSRPCARAWRPVSWGASTPGSRSSASCANIPKNKSTIEPPRRCAPNSVRKKSRH